MKKYILSAFVIILLLVTVALANIAGYETADRTVDATLVSDISAPVDANQKIVTKADSKPRHVMKTDCGSAVECDPNCEPIPIEECTPEQRAACLSNSNCLPNSSSVRHENAETNSASISIRVCTPEQKEASLSNLENCENLDDNKTGVNCSPEEYRAWKKMQNSL